MARKDRREQERLLKKNQSKDPSYNKNLLLKMVDRGEAPIESLDPPMFRIELKHSGELYYTIDGKHVEKQHYFDEMKRLFVNPHGQKFDIPFRSEIK